MKHKSQMTSLLFWPIALVTLRVFKVRLEILETCRNKYLRQQSLMISRITLRRMVFAVRIATWVLRAAYLSVPEPLSFDELFALTASDYGTASKFVAASNWAPRWAMVEQISSGGRSART